MNITVTAGHTFHLQGIFASGDTLTANEGDNPTPQGAEILVSGFALNEGLITLQAEYNVYGVFGASGASLDVQGVLSNVGSIDVQGGAAFQHYGGGAVTGAQLVDTGVLLNSGSIRFGAAQYAPQEGYLGTAATLTDAGRLNNSGTLVFAGGAYGTGYGIASGAQADVSGSLNNSGLLSIDVYSFIIGASTYYGPGNGATVTDSGVLSNSGHIVIQGSAGDPFANYYSVTAAKLDITGTLGNSGTITVGGGVAGTTGGLGGTLIDAGVLNNAGLIALDPGAPGNLPGAATVAAGATLIDTGIISGAGTLFNAGTIVSGAGQTGLIAAASFVNDGIVRIATGVHFTIGSAITANAGFTGQFNLNTHSTLTLSGAVSAGEQVNFGQNSVLGLGDSQSFGGVLADISASSTIDFLNTLVSAAAVNGDVLRFTVTGSPFTLYEIQLAQPLAPGLSLHLSSDGNSGTDLTFI